MHNDDYVSNQVHDADVVNIANVYDPVKYMLDNLYKRTTRGLDNALNRAYNNSNEGATLQYDGVQLQKVEGDEHRDHFLYYDSDGVLQTYITVHKKTGKVEEWTLHFNNDKILIRYDYNLITDAAIEEEVSDNDGLWDGWGNSIDYWL